MKHFGKIIWGMMITLDGKITTTYMIGSRLEQMETNIMVCDEINSMLKDMTNE